MFPALFDYSLQPRWSFADEKDRDAAPQTTLSTGHLLVIEDNADLRETLMDILRYEGYQVSAVANGEEAVAYLQSQPRPVLILLDLMMPVMSGWEFRCQQLCDPALAAIPVVIISGAGDVRQQADLLNVADYLVKPIQVSLLLEAVRRYCG